MAVVYDTSVTGNVNGANSMAFGSLTTAEANEALICFVHASNVTPTALTFSSGTWTQLSGSPISLPSSGGKFFCYTSLASSILSGTTYTVTFTGGGFPQASGVISAYKGVLSTSSTAFIGATNTQTAASATSISQSVTTTAANSLVIGGVGQVNNQNMTVGSNQVELAEPASAGGFSRTISIRRDATSSSGASVTINITSAGPGGTQFGEFVIELKEATASFRAAKPFIMSQAVKRAAYY